AFIAFHAAIGVTVMQYPEPVKRLKEMGRAYIKFALENPLYYDLMFIMREPMNCLKTEEQWERGHQTFEFLKNTVQECMRMGALPKGDPESTALMIWSAMHGLVSLPVRGRMLMFEGKDIHQLIYSAFEEFDKMLTALHRLESKQ
ncbi:MAG: TetR-like C-terminal domain-containing protein, partial [Bacteroidota bacterium]